MPNVCRHHSVDIDIDIDGVQPPIFFSLALIAARHWAWLGEVAAPPAPYGVWSKNTPAPPRRQKELIEGTFQAAESQAIQPQDALYVREQHLNHLSMAARSCVRRSPAIAGVLHSCRAGGAAIRDAERCRCHSIILRQRRPWHSIACPSTE
jgi:hypothetical protein